MASHTSPATSAKLFRRSTRRPTARESEAARRPSTPTAKKSWHQFPGDWLFPCFFLCMAVTALPLMGIRWTTPESMSSWHAFADALILALPVVVPLPFLFFGCVVLLILQPAARTTASIALLCTAVLMGFAGVHALVA